MTYSKEGLEGSMLTYHCGIGSYPHPVSKRACQNGEWSVMLLPNGKRVSVSTCRGMLKKNYYQCEAGLIDAYSITFDVLVNNRYLWILIRIADLIFFFHFWIFK